MILSQCSDDNYFFYVKFTWARWYSFRTTTWVRQDRVSKKCPPDKMKIGCKGNCKKTSQLSAISLFPQLTGNRTGIVFHITKIMMTARNRNIILIWNLAEIYRTTFCYSFWRFSKKISLMITEMVGDSVFFYFYNV